MKRAATLAFLSIALSGCSEPLEFADWTIPVPAGTRIVEYAGVRNEVREGQRIELVEDLVIGPRGDDDNYAFFRPRRVGVDTGGNIYVLDEGNTQMACHMAEWATQGHPADRLAQELKRDAYRERLTTARETMTQGIYRAAMNDAMIALGEEPAAPGRLQI